MNNQLRERPLSPHLQIYRPQTSSVCSVFHRWSELVLFGWVAFIGGWVGLLLGFPRVFDWVFAWMHTVLVKGCVGFGAFALVYHMLSFLRYSAWDMGYGFSLKSLDWGAYALALGSLILGGFVLWKIF